MAFVKFANCQVIDRRRAGNRSVGRVASTTRCGSFDVSPNDDGNYLYVAVRACTADVPNLNFDMLPSSELETAYETFKGSSVFLNHENDDPEKARGAIIDAKWHDEDPNDKWVEILMEMDEDRCPKLCSLIRSGEMDTVSMGCNVESTTCSICGNVAEYPFEFCQHVQQKGASFGGKLAYEICNGIEFFEESWVYDPADPTAHALTMMDGEGTFTSEGCDDMGVAKWSKAAGSRKVAGDGRGIDLYVSSWGGTPYVEATILDQGGNALTSVELEIDVPDGWRDGDSRTLTDAEMREYGINPSDPEGSEWNIWEFMDNNAPDSRVGGKVAGSIDALPWSDTSGYLGAAKNGGMARPKTASWGAWNVGGYDEFNIGWRNRYDDAHVYVDNSIHGVSEETMRSFVRHGFGSYHYRDFDIDYTWPSKNTDDDGVMVGSFEVYFDDPCVVVGVIECNGNWSWMDNIEEALRNFFDAELATRGVSASRGGKPKYNNDDILFA